MRLVFALLLTAALPPLAASSPAAAQEGCAPRAEVEAFLARDYQEQPIATGIANNGGLVEVFASPERTTWTLLITMPDGRTCMMAAGENWIASTQTPIAETQPEPGT